MNKNVFAIIFLLLMSFGQTISAQIDLERPKKAFGRIFAEVILIDDNEYQYTYWIRNADSSEQVLSNFSIRINDNSFYEENIDIPSPSTKKWYIDGLTKGYISGSAASRRVDFPSENGLTPGESIEISFFSQGRPQAAAIKLQAFLNEVEAIPKQQLYPEAYVLLKYNGEYLLEKLQE